MILRMWYPLGFNRTISLLYDQMAALAQGIGRSNRPASTNKINKLPLLVTRANLLAGWELRIEMFPRGSKRCFASRVF